MNRIETLQGIIDRYFEGVIDIEELDREIAALPEPKQKTGTMVKEIFDHLYPNGYEHKPDESRLLSDDEVMDLVTDYHFSGKQNRHILVGSAVKAQDLKTARIKDEAHQAEIAKLFEYLWEHSTALMTKDEWRTLKARYLNQDTSPSSH
jgi:hypothetical protein